ncbi:MAG: hypothetical protein AAFV77_13710, partial [Planctomycetota bacterium]
DVHGITWTREAFFRIYLCWKLRELGWGIRTIQSHLKISLHRGLSYARRLDARPCNWITPVEGLAFHEFDDLVDQSIEEMEAIENDSDMPLVKLGQGAFERNITAEAI